MIAFDDHRRRALGLGGLLALALLSTVAMPPSTASARTICNERWVERYIERRSPDWEELVPIRRVRRVRGVRARAHMGEPEFTDPVVGPILRPGCVAVAVGYRVPVELEGVGRRPVYHAPREVWGRAVLILRNGKLRLVAHSQDAPSTENVDVSRRLMVRNVNRGRTQELVELIDGTHRPELRAFRVRRGRLLPAPVSTEVPEIRLQLARMETEGPISRSAVRSALQPRMVAFERCVATRALAEREPAVDRTLELLLDSRGRLLRVQQGPGQRSVAFLQPCVDELAQRWYVSAAPGGGAGTTRVRVPLSFLSR